MVVLYCLYLTAGLTRRGRGFRRGPKEDDKPGHVATERCFWPFLLRSAVEGFVCIVWLAVVDPICAERAVRCGV
ncbi:hypothetical protein IWZ03DRAFT_365835 [Phyllosticta citriasiana]|uniref:Secreted protein n=1 Tax=Phyllosticta citriasiana TaxID=595635 RepID=A0ABR1KYG2_9PEZI